MKRIFLLLALTAIICPGMRAGKRTVTCMENGKKLVIELADTTRDGRKVTDTLSITTYESGDTGSGDAETRSHRGHRSLQLAGFADHVSGNFVALTSIVCVFGMPVLLIFFIYYLRHKNRLAKYRLAERALACGQPLPPGFFEENLSPDQRSRGIKNMCLGTGLFIFLHALTDEFALACIGLLVMFTGVGQLLIHYTRPKSDNSDTRPEAERGNGSEAHNDTQG